MMLEKIVNNRRILIEKEKQVLSPEEVIQKAESLIDTGYTPQDFFNRIRPEKPLLIAEIKKSSPSKGIIRNDFDIGYIADAYGSSEHVKAISVLTEPDYFSGQYGYIQKTINTAKKPVLMKDFIIDEYQIYRGFIEGASAILLIAAVLSEAESRKLSGIASGLGMNILFETHTVSEFRRAIDTGFNLIGINNRDLKTFVTDISNTGRIIDSAGRPKGCIIISESGINSRDDVNKLLGKGVDGFLIGEQFMKQNNISAAISDIFG